MKTQTNKREKVDAILLASFYAAVILAAITFNLITYILETL